MVAEPESEDEARARRAVESVLARRLTRFEPVVGRRSPDYTDDRDEAFEMKGLTSEELRELRHEIGNREFFPSMKLMKRWSIVIEAPTMDDKFRPLPDYPADDEDLIAELEDEGFSVQRRSQREAEWGERFSGERRPTPRVRDLPAELEQHLLVLERGGIMNTRAAEPRTSEQRHALAAIRRLTHDGICIAHDASAELEAGIALSVSYGYVRTGRPDTLAFRVQAWLDSDLSENLRESLWPEFERRHAVLVFDSLEPEYWSAQEAGLAFIPSQPLTPPAEVDVVWCLVGALLLRYEHGGRWVGVEVS